MKKLTGQWMLRDHKNQRHSNTTVLREKTVTLILVLSSGVLKNHNSHNFIPLFHDTSHHSLQVRSKLSYSIHEPQDMSTQLLLTSEINTCRSIWRTLQERWWGWTTLWLHVFTEPKMCYCVIKFVRHFSHILNHLFKYYPVK